MSMQNVMEYDDRRETVSHDNCVGVGSGYGEEGM